MLATLLQEKLQNAEDAGASEVRFVLDPLSYSSEKIMAPIPGRNDLTGMQVTEDKFHKKVPHSNSTPFNFHLHLSYMEAYHSRVSLSLCSTTASSQRKTGTGYEAPGSVRRRRRWTRLEDLASASAQSTT